MTSVTREMVLLNHRICHSIIWIFTVFAFFNPTDSELLNASVDFHVEGDGFHRTIHYFVEVQNLNEDNCHVALYIELPKFLYVNVDELADLRRNDQVIACSEGETNVEIFAEEAEDQRITICSVLIDNKSVLSLPLHQRYQKARKETDYVSIVLPSPKLLLGCKNRIKEYLVSKIKLCEPCVDLSLKWREITYEMKSEDYEWKIPVGDLSQRHYVTYITLFTTSVGTIFVLKSLWR